MAQSPMHRSRRASSPSSRLRMKQELTRWAPGLVLISCRAGRTVSAVE